ncbi:MAG: M48 family metalloprotease [Pseudomonadota bacterium]
MPPSQGGAARPTTIPRDPRSQAEGDRAHPQILAQLGGAYDNPRVADHVERIGRRLVAVSEQPSARWTFTVLDNPDINAFAIPGGYVYVTRGLVGLANDEASLAGVIGHEIGHVTAAHGASRQQRQGLASLGVLLGTVGLAAVGIDPVGIGDLLSTAAGGALASYSREDEREADQLGIRYLALAGYDPLAQAEFLDVMGRNAQLEAAIEGRRYDPNQTSFFATHPATGGRVREARAFAQQFPLAGQGERQRGRHLAAIDGIAWGPSAEQGFVEGGRFVHPELGFSFAVPDGYRLRNSPSNITLAGRDGSGIVFDGGRASAPDPASYLARTWAAELQRSGQIGQLSTVRSGAPNGLPLAQATAPARINDQSYTLLLTVIRYEGRFFRFAGFLPAGSRAGPVLDRTAQSFRALSAAERRTLSQRRLDIVRVQPGASEASIAAQMRVEQRPAELFRVLNDRPGGAGLSAGESVKIVR